ncbi:unnamed protein product [Sphenostylis stenocarpa]|uniref:Ubiquitin-like domain-containing protein n=1 Tax=Sphenostylis stenocarpa TaxID=92480 RepID=A0AA87B7I6_9FABA|nr:unnamed protein product [Sphenostylis stenocarpa]
MANFFKTMHSSSMPASPNTLAFNSSLPPKVLTENKEESYTVSISVYYDRGGKSSSTVQVDLNDTVLQLKKKLIKMRKTQTLNAEGMNIGLCLNNKLSGSERHRSAAEEERGVNFIDTRDPDIRILSVSSAKCEGKYRTTFEQYEAVFCMRVELSNTFQEIKEKIKTLTNIPVDRQTLLFNGQVLQNEALFIDTISEISPCLQLLVRPSINEYDLPQWITNVSKLDRDEMQEMLSSIPDAQNMSFPMDDPSNASVVLPENPAKIEEFISSMTHAPPEEQFPLPNKVSFKVKSKDVRRVPLFMRMTLNDTVLQLKQAFIKAKKPRSLTVKDMMVITKFGDELHDHMSMLECGMLNMAYVYVYKRSDVAAMSVARLKSGKMLKVIVVPQWGAEKIHMEVNSRSSLEDLRFELEKCHQHVLPENLDYFFKSKNIILVSEMESFEMLGIKEGDTIERRVRRAAVVDSSAPSETTFRPLLPTPPEIVRFMVKTVEYRARHFTLVMDLDDTVMQLKEKINRTKKPRT